MRMSRIATFLPAFSRLAPARFIRSSVMGGIAGLFLATCITTVTPVHAQSASKAPTSTNSDIDRAVTALRAITTMRADFVQTDRSGQRVNGVMTLKNPGRIRFEYDKSTPMLIVSDGRALTMVDYEVNQVQRWPIRNSPLGALLDPARDVARYGRLLETAHPDVISLEVRDPAKPEYGTITLVMIHKPNAPGGLELASWVALDSQNRRTTVRLSGHSYGMDVADSAFRFRDPRRAAGRPGR